MTKVRIICYGQHQDIIYIPELWLWQGHHFLGNSINNYMMRFNNQDAYESCSFYSYCFTGFKYFKKLKKQLWLSGKVAETSKTQFNLICYVRKEGNQMN